MELASGPRCWVLYLPAEGGREARRHAGGEECGNATLSDLPCVLSAPRAMCQTTHKNHLHSVSFPPGLPAAPRHQGHQSVHPLLLVANVIEANATTTAKRRKAPADVAQAHVRAQRAHTFTHSLTHTHMTHTHRVRVYRYAQLHTALDHDTPGDISCFVFHITSYIYIYILYYVFSYAYR